MGQITVDQSQQVVATLIQNADWRSIDFDLARLQDLVIRDPKEAGRQFTTFLKNGGRIVGEPKIIHIHRNGFNPIEFIGSGSSIIMKETDWRSVALTELDLNKVKYVTMLKKGETSINGEEKLKRLKKDGHIRLDADILFTLWKNRHLIPESWKERGVNGNTKFIYFDGTVLRRVSGHRCILYLYWCGVAWRWDVRWLDNDWRSDDLSAVLES